MSEIGELYTCTVILFSDYKNMSAYSADITVPIVTGSLLNQTAVCIVPVFVYLLVCPCLSL